jgi:hypothetical protein
MLSESEQRLWDEIEHNYRAEDDGTSARLPATIIGGAWGTVLLVLFGVTWAGVAVGTATVLAWLLWRFLPQQPDAEERTDAADESPPLTWPPSWI